MTQPTDKNLREAEELADQLKGVFDPRVKTQIIATALQAKDDEAARLVEALKEITKLKAPFERGRTNNAKAFHLARIISIKAIAAWEGK